MSAYNILLKQEIDALKRQGMSHKEASKAALNNYLSLGVSRPRPVAAPRPAPRPAVAPRAIVAPAYRPAVAPRPAARAPVSQKTRSTSAYDKILKQEIEQLKRQGLSHEAASKVARNNYLAVGGAPLKARAMSPYNAYMSSAIPRIKAQTGADHKTAFSMAAAEWSARK